ncbi:hypothetical protein [uncultured Gulosibacter sp.]|uniref:hypothetical protein n=1 Tax=uncultured Gulosibacter sp. TaxID=1339167 RepID=UPI00288B2F94|nr:hypothetical protein [uncultured Gulosibacter sp.]
MSNQRHGGDRGGKRYGGGGRDRNNHRGGSRRGKGGPSNPGYRGGGRSDSYRSRERFDERSSEARGKDHSRGSGKYRDRREDRDYRDRWDDRSKRGYRDRRDDRGSRDYRDQRDQGRDGRRRRYDDDRRYSTDRDNRPKRNRGDWQERDKRSGGGGDYRGRSDRPRNERGERRYNDRNFDRDRSGGRSHRPESKRGGAEPRRDFSSRPHELRAIRETHIDPELPDEITERDLPMRARVELKTLSHENYVTVARHLVMASMLIDTDPELAHEHALSASRRGGRVAMVRETLAITAYQIGDYALALRELRTYRRISGRDDEIALMVDCERGLGRPDRAIELGQSVDRSKLDTQQQVLLAIAMSGARLDLGEIELARAELEIPQLDRTRAFSYSPALFRAYATVLDELGDSEATLWESAADRAEAALIAAQHDEFETVTIITERLETEPDKEPATPLAEESVESQIRAEYDELIAEVERAATDAAASNDAPKADAAETISVGNSAQTLANCDREVTEAPAPAAAAQTESESVPPEPKPSSNSKSDDDQPSLFDL